MKLKNIFAFVTFLAFVFLFADVSLAQRKTQKRNTKPQSRQNTTSKSSQNKNISVVYNKEKDKTTVNLNFAFAASNYQQIFHIGGAYSDDDLGRAALSILSISKNYRYDKYSNVRILADGKLLYQSNEYNSYRQARVDENGNAVEIISFIMSVLELKRLASARRVDVTVWTDSFILNAGNIYALRDFVAKIEPLELKAENSKKESSLKTDDTKPQPSPKPEVASIPQCSLTIEQSPEIKGIRLGMPMQEVASKFSNPYQFYSGNKLNSDGVEVINFDFDTNGGLPKTDDWQFIQSLRLQFLDDKIYSLSIAYSNIRLKLWKNTKGFVEVLSQKMKLPEPLIDGEISYDNGYNPSKLANCNGWSMKLQGNEIFGVMTLVNTAAKSAYLKAAEEKKRTEQKQKQDAFKPQ